MEQKAANIEILLNGDPFSLEADATVSDLIAQLALGGRRVAVELNEEVLPRSEYPARRLQSGDRVEVVRAIGGG